MVPVLEEKQATMKHERLSITDLIVFYPRVFNDSRGFFFESFNQQKYLEIIGEPYEFVQDNISQSDKNVLRGLHLQLAPFSQGKLVSVLRGAVLDVAVDVRLDSPTFGEHVAIELSEDNQQQLWIPPGFAHGFLSLHEKTLFSYKCTNYYAPENETTLLWDDTDLRINWGCNEPIVSDKDQKGLLLPDLVSLLKKRNV
jgi:dTDP-4-dehydrorhamnose 3,5-epimerase